MTPARSSSTSRLTWLDVVTLLVILALVAFEVVYRTGRMSVMVSLTGLILSLATRRHDRQSTADAPPPPAPQEAADP